MIILVLYVGACGTYSLTCTTGGLPPNYFAFSVDVLDVLLCFYCSSMIKLSEVRTSEFRFLEEQNAKAQS